MQHNALSIRSFIGSADFDQSRSFYRDMGFEEVSLGDTMSLFKTGNLGFYLQKAYVKDWIDNSMLFLEVDNLDAHWKALSALALEKKYPGVRVSPIKDDTWGREYFVHDPCGILWHIGSFKK